jgi:DNA-binding MarR family transcriptional regulator
MFLIDKQFLKPNKLTRVLALLENVDLNPEITQAELARKTSLSPAMVNSYIKNFQSEELIELVKVNGKCFRYELTDQGKARRRNLLGQYMAEIVQIYSNLKESIRKKIDLISASQIRTLALFGASETCEIVLSVLTPSDPKILMVIDNDRSKQGHPFHGHVVAPPQLLEAVALDAVLITSFGRHEEIHRQLEPVSQKRHLQIHTL